MVFGGEVTSIPNSRSASEDEASEGGNPRNGCEVENEIHSLKYDLMLFRHARRFRHRSLDFRRIRRKPSTALVARMFR